VARVCLKNFGAYSSGNCPGITPGSLLSGPLNLRAGTINRTNIEKSFALSGILLINNDEVSPIYYF
jgi:hypothetical protein